MCLTTIRPQRTANLHYICRCSGLNIFALRVQWKYISHAKYMLIYICKKNISSMRNWHDMNTGYFYQLGWIRWPALSTTTCLETIFLTKLNAPNMSHGVTFWNSPTFLILRRTALQKLWTKFTYFKQSSLLWMVSRKYSIARSIVAEPMTIMFSSINLFTGISIWINDCSLIKKGSSNIKYSGYVGIHMKGIIYKINSSKFLDI